MGKGRRATVSFEISCRMALVVEGDGEEGWESNGASKGSRENG